MNQNPATTGIILASGEGSRLNELSEELKLPKHLFPIGNSSIIERLVTSLSHHCNQIICITPLDKCELFTNKFSKHPFPVEIISKTSEGFRGDFKAAVEASKNSHIVLTVGDLVFPDNEIENFLSKVQKKPERMFLAIDSTRIFMPLTAPFIDFRILAIALSKEVLLDISDINPESFVSVASRFLKYLTKNQIRLSLMKSLFNINTPESYLEAKKQFKNS